MSTPAQPPLHHAAVSEFISTAFLLIAVVGSGIAAEKLSGGNDGLALLANALATSGALFMLILTFGSLSGAHMNPIVTVAAGLLTGFPKARIPVYIVVQIAGAIVGTWIAHLMFNVSVLQTSTHGRTGIGVWAGEVVATLGLLLGIVRCASYGIPVVAGVVATYIGGAYWFTSSTSFANPAVTVARSLTDTFSGIQPSDVPGFILAQLIGLGLGLGVIRFLRS